MTKKTLPEWDQLGFGLVETDEIYRAVGDRNRDPIWEPGSLGPFAKIALSPAAAFMSYGQGVFEGLKARRTGDGRILLFRPEENARRFGRHAQARVRGGVVQLRCGCTGSLREINALFVPQSDLKRLASTVRFSWPEVRQGDLTVGAA